MNAGPEMLTLEQLGMYSAKFERGEIDEEKLDCCLLYTSMLMVSLAASLAACGQDSGKNSNSTDLSKTETEASSGQTGEEETTLVYGSADYTRINPAMDEHGEINLLLFNGLTAQQDADEALDGAEAHAMQHDGALLLAVGIHVGAVSYTHLTPRIEHHLFHFQMRTCRVVIHKHHAPFAFAARGT